MNGEMLENAVDRNGESYFLPTTHTSEMTPMNTSQISFLYEIERGEMIPLGKLAYLRERTRNVLYDFIIKKFLEAEKNGLSQAELARRIGKRPEVVSRWLGSPGNWRIDTISDLLVGIGAEELDPQSVSLLNRAQRNRTYPDWLQRDRTATINDNEIDAHSILGGSKRSQINQPTSSNPANNLLR